MFEIDEGDVTGIKRISFVGNEHFSDGTLRGKIRTTESAWWRFLSSDDRFDPDRLNLDRELLRKFYLSEGYADFRVVSAVAELAPDRSGFFITFTINEGERYKFGKIDVTSRFQGLDVDTLKSYLTMSEGDWYDADEVEKTVTAMADAVGTLGYAFVDVRPNIRRNKDDAHRRRDVRRPGRPARLRRAHQHLGQHPNARQGDPPRVPTGRGRRLLDRQGAPQPAAPQEPRLLREGRRLGRARLGAGQDQPRGPGGRAEHRRNLLRRRLLDDIGHPGRHLDPRAQPARQGPGPAARLVARHLEHLDRPELHRAVFPRSQRSSAGFDIFRTSNDRQNIASYSDRSLGFALRSGWAFTEHTRQQVRYTLRQSEIYNVQPWASSIVQRQAGSSVVSEVSETIAWDTRDTRLNTTKGWLLRNTVAVRRPGRHANTTCATTVDGVIYQTIIEDFVASIGGSVGIIAPYNNSTLRLNNRFFIGGDTLRGFRVGGIGPRDANTTDSLGGKYYYTGTAELSFPLGLPKEIGILGKAFVDVGSLWGTADDPNQVTILDSQLMRVASGFGIQWISPFGPIRVDYAIPIQKEYFDKTENFRFSFGTRF